MVLLQHMIIIFNYFIFLFMNGCYKNKTLKQKQLYNNYIHVIILSLSISRGYNLRKNTCNNR